MELTADSGKSLTAACVAGLRLRHAPGMPPRRLRLPAVQNRPVDAPIGLIPIDSLYSPIRQVSYKVGAFAA